MSLLGPALDHLAYLLFAVATHAAVGYALVVAFTDRPPRAGVVGAVLPDVDLLFPLAWAFPLNHRGLTHTLAFAAAVVALVAAARRPRWSAGAAALGLSSHLLVDSFTKSGVAWLYPLTTERVGVAASIHSGWGAALLWGVVALGIVVGRRSTDATESAGGAVEAEAQDASETPGTPRR
ncbi:metal-dependent hydrolase [Halogeometricum sp. S1BR25-6]|uniref:Metal-dependent hydrolase n=1 Tax=Halogeometricum salsisoli TaxID=2950536 RepID=A0ABU2GKL2_9EURY|nr:metal-dependent hydrolase [Halogeometricum sp. S1BR25-6]MDS0300829.1 metal-dependent hydrolase [Halogeometricum sp. S1BR25-6]